MTTYYVDVYRTLATVIKVEAKSDEQAAQIAESKIEDVQWDLSEHLTDDFDITVCGKDSEDGEREYYF
jgi:hypothetical protein